MSVEHVKAFIEKMKSDEAFRKRVLAIEEPEARLEFIRKEGFDCKVNDIQLYLENFESKDGSQIVILTEKGGCRGMWYAFCFG